MNQQKNKTRKHTCQITTLLLATLFLQACAPSASDSSSSGESAFVGACPIDAATASEMSSQDTSETFFEDIQYVQQQNSTKDDNKITLRSRYVHVNIEAIKAALRSSQTRFLKLPLFNNKSVQTVIEKIERISENNLVVTARDIDSPLSAVTLVINDDVLVANMVNEMSGEQFEIQYEGDNIHSIKQTQALPDVADCIELETPHEEHAMQEDQDYSTLQTTPLIDMFVAYTPRARSNMGGTNAIKALIQMGIADTNRAFTNSGVNLSVRLVGTMEVSNNETGDFSADLNSLKNTNGRWSSVHTQRKKYGADQVTLVGYYPNNSVSGIGYVGSNYSSAFSIVKTSSFSQYSFTHELGHNVGLKHADGLENTSGKFRTIMAYGIYSRIPRFSNPNVPYNKYATGNSSHNSSAKLNSYGYKIAALAAQILPLDEAPADIPTPVECH